MKRRLPKVRYDPRALVVDQDVCRFQVEVHALVLNLVARPEDGVLPRRSTNLVKCGCDSKNLLPGRVRLHAHCSLYGIADIEIGISKKVVEVGFRIREYQIECVAMSVCFNHFDDVWIFELQCVLQIIVFQMERKFAVSLDLFPCEALAVLRMLFLVSQVS